MLTFWSFGIISCTLLKNIWKWSSAQAGARGRWQCCTFQHCQWTVSIKPRLPFSFSLCSFCFRGIISAEFIYISLTLLKYATLSTTLAPVWAVFHYQILRITTHNPGRLEGKPCIGIILGIFTGTKLTWHHHEIFHLVFFSKTTWRVQYYQNLNNSNPILFIVDNESNKILNDYCFQYQSVWGMIVLFITLKTHLVKY